MTDDKTVNDETPRWLATINYRTDQGIAGIMVGFEEFVDFGDVIESGPDWDTIDSISIRRFRDANDTLTVEQSMER